MTEHYDQRESLHAAKKANAPAYESEVPIFYQRWGIAKNEDGLEEAFLCEACHMPLSGKWFASGHCLTAKDVFTTELAARNELEQRLYRRSENLRKHREQMTRLLVRCADTMGGDQ